MVASDEMLSECLLARQSPRRQNCGADILSARSPRDESNSSNTSCENFNHQKASFAGVAPSCGRGDSRVCTPGSNLPPLGLQVDYTQDANWDTTAVVGFNSTIGTWGVTQRYVYSPYGSITVLTADRTTPPAGTQPTVNNLYQGMTLDAMAGLYYERFRNYNPGLGTWISQDPLSYVNGANTYQFVGGGPVDSVDPSGLGVGHHIIPAQLFDDQSLFTKGSPGYKFFKKFTTGETTPPHGFSKEHSDYTKAVKKLIQKWLKDHPKVDPKCKEFSEEDAEAIADDVLKSDDPDIRSFLRSVFRQVTKPSEYFKQMMDTFDTAGEVAGQGQPVSAAQAIAGSGPIPGTENLTEDQLVQYEDAASNAQQADIAAQQSEGVLGEAIDSIDAGSTDIEFFFRNEAPSNPLGGLTSSAGIFQAEDVELFIEEMPK